MVFWEAFYNLCGENISLYINYSMAMSDAQRQTKLRSGIQPIGITFNTNYLANSQLPFTSNILEFPFLTEKLSGLEKYPLISTNVKYIPSRMEYLPQHERVQIFFSMPRLIQFVSELPIEDDTQKYIVLKHNIKFMLEMLFTITYPFIKKVNLASDADQTLSIFEAIKKEITIQKNNTYLNLDGKICTVTDVVLLDTIDTNPVYVKLYDLITDYKTKQSMALRLLKNDLTARLKEFTTEISNYKTEVVKRITKELDKTYGASTLDAASLVKLKRDLTDREKQIEIDDELFNLTFALFKFKQNSGTIGSIQKVITEINTLSKTASVTITPLNYASLTLNDAKKTQTDIDALPAGSAGKDTLKRGIDALVALMQKLEELKRDIDDVPILSKTSHDNKIISLKKQNDDDTAKIKAIEESQKVKPEDIGGTSSSGSSSFTVKIVGDALNNAVHTNTLSSLRNSVIDGLITDYKLMDDLDKLQTVLKGYLTTPGFDDSTIKTIKDAIKGVYDSRNSFFSQSSQLAKGFMRLRKMSGFAFLMTKLYHYQDNQAIEYEYGINTNADPDLTRGEYSFRTSVIDALRAYYNPNRQPVANPIYKAINSEEPITNRKEIKMDEIMDMFEDSKAGTQIQDATVDLVTTQNRKIYECHIRINVVGGILTKENSDLVGCSYENMSIAADGIKTYYKLVNSEFIDLTNQIKDAEQKNNIKYGKTSANKTAVGPGPAPAPGLGPALGPGLGPGPAPGPALGPAPALGARPAAAPALTKISDNDLETIINKNRNKSKTQTFTGPPIMDKDLVAIVNNADYVEIKNFLDTVYEYQRQMPTKTLPINPSSSITYGEDYENKKNTAISQIDLNINKKITVLKRQQLSNEERNTASKEKAILEELKTVVANIDKQMWPETKGGKKTRKLRKHKRKLRKPRKSRKHRL